RSGDEDAWWQKLNIDPLPVALKLWQHTRLNGDGLAPSENITSSQVARKRDTSVQNLAGTNDGARADVEGAVSKEPDPLARRWPRSLRTSLSSDTGTSSLKPKVTKDERGQMTF